MSNKTRKQTVRPKSDEQIQAILREAAERYGLVKTTTNEGSAK